jgi:predicted DNA-binding transcriptional regulator AlpA
VNQNPPVNLLTKPDVLAITKVTFPTIWVWMRAGKFPRSRIVGGKSMWLSSEVDAWLAGLQVRPLKGDAPLDKAPVPRKRRMASTS